MDVRKQIEDTLTTEVRGRIASASGTTPGAVDDIVRIGVPLLVGALGKNTSTTTGADALLQTLAAKHDGTLLDTIDALYSKDTSTDGRKILDHVLGSKASAATNQIARVANTSPDVTATVLSYVAPLILERLGQEKIAKSLDAKTLSGLLHGQADKKGGLLMNLATTLLDKDKDGQIADDILAMFLGKKR